MQGKIDARQQWAGGGRGGGIVTLVGVRTSHEQQSLGLIMRAKYFGVKVV